MRMKPPTRSIVIALSILILIGMMLAWAMSADYAWAHPKEPAVSIPQPAFVAHPTSINSLVFDWFYDGDQQSQNGLGYAVSNAGDVNNDGYDDVIVGAPFYTQTVYSEGVAYLFYGGAGGLRPDPVWTAGSGQKGARFGASVSTAGDVNSDGYDDVVIGAHRYNTAATGQSEEGRVYLFYGSADGLSASPDWILDGDQAGANFGVAVSTAGDVNSDGYDDIIIGASGYANNEGKVGKAYVFLGFGEGTTTLFWSVEGDQGGAKFGESVNTAGDVNNDGHADIIVGAPRYDGAEGNEGAAFVYYGDASVDLDPAWSVVITQTKAQFGAAVSTAGDVNGDGYDDVIVGAPAYTVTAQFEGGAFIFHSSAAGLSSSPDWQITGGQSNAHFGASVSTAGDVNGDGYADVLVGAPLYSTDKEHPAQEGAAFVFAGEEDGVRQTIYWSSDGGKAGTKFGASVSTAGDVNDDGCDDIIIGAPSYRRKTILYGRAFVFVGNDQSPRFHIYLPLILRVRESGRN